MYWEKRIDRSGKPYYGFIYFDSKLGKNVRLRRHEVPSDILTDAQADAFCRLRESEHEAAKLRIQRKLEWQSKFYKFDELLDLFKTDSKLRAPNSWVQSLYYLEHYAFDFFLNVKQSNNLNNWPMYFEELRDWLLTVQTSRTTKTGVLAYSSRNHVVRALNTFIDVMIRKGKMAPGAPKCRGFDSSLMNKRTIDDVLTQEEVVFIHGRLKELDESLLAADLFLVSVNTGLRLGEGLGLSLADVFQGEPSDNTFVNSMKKNSLSCAGFISLGSQLFDAHNPRGEDGLVQRKPLKGRKRIGDDFGRVVPLLEKEVFNAIARRFNEQNRCFKHRLYGDRQADYLLFNGLNKNGYTNLLRKAYEGSAYRYKSPHCARHTFATRFAGLTCGDFFLCKAVLGHRDIETTMDYVHIFAALNKAARSKEQVEDGMMLIE